jgi:flavin reductase (DIM6/NTAB) family NADH-FMN oxidoreductase RutF
MSIAAPPLAPPSSSAATQDERRVALPDPLASETFKAVMNRWCSGVTVISGRGGDRIHGMVASSFTSVSLDPITVLFCANHSTRTHAVVKAAGAFAVNLLAEDQLDTFRVFAGQAGDPEDRFAGEEIATAITGAPILARSLAWLDCRLVADYPGGNTHSIFLGQVVAAGVDGDGAAGRPPLTYFDRRAHRLGIPIR